MNNQSAQGNGQSQQSPISDLMFDWISILHNKAEGVNAYEKYLRDAQQENSQECVEMLNKLKENDVRMLAEVKQHVMMMLNRQGGEGRSAEQGQFAQQGRFGQEGQTSRQGEGFQQGQDFQQGQGFKQDQARSGTMDDTQPHH